MQEKRKQYRPNGKRATRSRTGKDIELVDVEDESALVSTRIGSTSPLERYVNSTHCTIGRIRRLRVRMMCSEMEKLMRRDLETSVL